MGKKTYRILEHTHDKETISYKITKDKLKSHITDQSSWLFKCLSEKPAKKIIDLTPYIDRDDLIRIISVLRQNINKRHRKMTTLMSDLSLPELQKLANSAKSISMDTLSTSFKEFVDLWSNKNTKPARVVKSSLSFLHKDALLFIEEECIFEFKSVPKAYYKAWCHKIGEWFHKSHSIEKKDDCVQVLFKRMASKCNIPLNNIPLYDLITKEYGNRLSAMYINLNETGPSVDGFLRFVLKELGMRTAVSDNIVSGVCDIIDTYEIKEYNFIGVISAIRDSCTNNPVLIQDIERVIVSYLQKTLPDLNTVYEYLLIALVLDMKGKLANNGVTGRISLTRMLSHCIAQSLKVNFISPDRVYLLIVNILPKESHINLAHEYTIMIGENERIYPGEYSKPN